MKKITVRIIAAILAIFMVMPMLFSCGGEAETTEKPNETEAPKETESETEQGEIELPQEPLELIKNGESEFTLVINQYAQFINDKVAYMIQDAVEAATGVELSFKKDYDLFLESLDIMTRSKYQMELSWVESGGAPGKFADAGAIEASYDKSAPYEILIGNTDRPESARAIADLKSENEYILRMDGNKIVLVASSNKALIVGAEYFISEYLSDGMTGLTIENLKKSATIEVVEQEKKVFYGMTQAEVDAAFGPLLDGLFTGKTTETIVKTDIGYDLQMHFNDMLYKDGTYYSYYISGKSPVPGLPSVGLATSTNGWDWVDGGQIINPEYDYELGLCAFQGVYEDDDGIIYLVYEASSEKYPGSVALAVSYNDGKTWIKEGPIFKKDVLGMWARYNIGTPDIYYKDGVWYVTFHGFGEPGGGYDGYGGCQTGVAYGENLRKLTVVDNPVVPTEKDTAWGGTTGRRDIFYCDGYYYMVYEISSERVDGGYLYAMWSHMFARSKDMINWEITQGPQIEPVMNVANDGPSWVVIDGELYVFCRTPSTNWTTVIRLESAK